MGYYINVRETYVTIKKENFEACRQALISLGDGDWVEACTESQTLEEMLTEWRWKPEYDKDGDINNLYFESEKLGDEEKLFNALAPYIEADSYIEIGGEENAIWRYCFDGKTMYEDTAVLDWDCNTDIVNAILEKKEVLPLLLGIHPSLDGRIEKALKKETKHVS